MASQENSEGPNVGVGQNTDPQGPQVNADSEGLQVNIDSEGLQVDFRSSEGLQAVPHGPEKELAIIEVSQPKAMIIGLQRRTFWALLIGIILIIAAIGGGVGGALAKKHSSLPPARESKSSTSESTLTPTDDLPSPPPANDTALTIAYWGTSRPNKERYMCLFYQSSSKELWGRFWNSTSGWAAGSFPIGDPPIIARGKTPLAQSSWSTAGGSQEILLFYIDTNNTVRDIQLSSGITQLQGSHTSQIPKWIIGNQDDTFFRGGHNMLKIPAGKDVQLGASMTSLTAYPDSTILLYFDKYEDREGPVSNTTVYAVAYGTEFVGFNLTTNIIPAEGAGIGVYSIHYLNGSEAVEMYTQDQNRNILGCRWVLSSWSDPIVFSEDTGLVACNQFLNSSELGSSGVVPLGTSIVSTLYSSSKRVFFVGEMGIVKQMYIPAGVGEVWGLTTVVAGGAENGSIAAAQWQTTSRVVYQKRVGGLGEVELVINGNLSEWKATEFSM